MKANVFTDSFSHTLTLEIKFDGEDMSEYEHTYEWMEKIAYGINHNQVIYIKATDGCDAFSEADRK